MEPLIDCCAVAEEGDNELQLLAHQQALLDRVLRQQESAEAAERSPQPQSEELELPAAESWIAAPPSFERVSTALQCVVPAATRWHCSCCTSASALTGHFLLVTKTLVFLLDARTAALHALLNCGAKARPLAGAWALPAASVAEALKQKRVSCAAPRRLQSREEGEKDRGHEAEKEELEPGELAEDAPKNHAEERDSPLPSRASPSPVDSRRSVVRICLRLEAANCCFFTSHADKSVRLWRVECSPVALGKTEGEATWTASALSLHRQHSAEPEALAVCGGCFCGEEKPTFQAASAAQTAHFLEGGFWMLCLTGDARGRLVVWGLHGLLCQAQKGAVVESAKKIVLFSLQPLQQKVSEAAVTFVLKRGGGGGCCAARSPLESLADGAASSGRGESEPPRFLAAVGYESGAVLVLDLRERAVVASVGSFRDRVTGLLFTGLQNQTPPSHHDEATEGDWGLPLLICASRALEIELWNLRDADASAKQPTVAASPVFRTRLNGAGASASSLAAGASSKGKKNGCGEGSASQARQWLTLGWHPALPDALFVGAPSGEFLWLSLEEVASFNAGTPEASVARAEKAGGRRGGAKGKGQPNFFRRLATLHSRPLFSISCFASSVLLSASPDGGDSVQRLSPPRLIVLTSSLDRCLSLSAVEASALQTRSGEASSSTSPCVSLWKLCTLGGWAESLSASPRLPSQAWLGCGDATLRSLDLSAAVKRQLLELRSESEEERALLLPALGKALFVLRPSQEEALAGGCVASSLQFEKEEAELKEEKEEGEETEETEGGGTRRRWQRLCCPGEPFESSVFWRQLLSGVNVTAVHPQKPELLAFGLADGHFGIMDSGRAAVQMLSAKQALFSPVSAVAWLSLGLSLTQAKALPSSETKAARSDLALIAAAQDGQLLTAFHLEANGAAAAAPRLLDLVLKASDEDTPSPPSEPHTLRGALPLAMPFPASLLKLFATQLEEALTASLTSVRAEEELLGEANSPAAPALTQAKTKVGLSTNTSLWPPAEVLLIFELQKEGRRGVCASSAQRKAGTSSGEAEGSMAIVALPWLLSQGDDTTREKPELVFLSLGRIRLPLSQPTASAVWFSPAGEEALLAVGDADGALFVASWSGLLELLLKETLEAGRGSAAAVSPLEKCRGLLVSASDLERLAARRSSTDAPEEASSAKPVTASGCGVTSLSWTSDLRESEEEEGLDCKERALLALTTGAGSAFVVAVSVPDFLAHDNHNLVLEETLQLLARLRGCCATSGVLAEKQATPSPSQGQLLSCCWISQLAPAKVQLLLGKEALWGFVDASLARLARTWAVG